MAILINGSSPESLGITGVTIREATLNASSATLAVEADTYDADTALAHNAAVTITVDGTQIFKGRVRRTPRSASGSSEGWSYEVKDAWDQLERLTYQVQRGYLDALGNPLTNYIGEVVWEADIPLGQRISQVLSYAIGCGVPIAIGTIESGIPWYRTSYKDRTCAEILREMMRLMPAHQLWLDTRESTPTMHMRARASLGGISYDVTAGNVIVSNEIEAMDAEVISEVVIRYEKPIQVGEQSSVRIYEDVAPPGADGTADSSLVESVPLDGLNAQKEYAPIVTRDIPQASDTDDDKIDWWIDHTPALAALAEKFGKAAVAMKITVAGADVPAQNVFAHRLKVVDDGITRPAPINPNATPVTQTANVADYPREIVEGTLPDWAGKRYRPVAALATLAIAGTTAETDGDLEKALLEIFSVRKTFGATEYLCAEASGTVRGTNATTKNYERTVSFDGGETPPTGIAAGLLAELSQIRHTGSLTLTGEEIDLTPRVGNALSLTNGRSEWETMGEIIQAVTHDLFSGTTTLTFGPPEQLGATDMVERLRAMRRNSHSTPTAANANDGVGGNAASPLSNFNITGGERKEGHPWKMAENGDATIYVGEGRVWQFIASGNSPHYPGGSGEEVKADFFSDCIEFAGGDVTVTDDGYIYAEITGEDTGQIFSTFELLITSEGGGPKLVNMRAFKMTGTPTVYFSTEAPSANTTANGNVHLLIGTVTLEGGVAKITKQQLRHDPTPQIYYFTVV